MIFIALGSNLSSSFGNRYENLKLAISFLETYKIQIIKKSSFYESLSFPDKKNPKFINAVISINTKLPPVDLMSVLIFIEEKLERKRSKKNDPRTCDLDIIDYNNQVLNFKYKNFDLDLPHKKLGQRNFVLYPLMEICSDWKHPQTGEPIASLIKNLPDDEKKAILKISNP
tara:strand:- start:1580 stop:2092 length:513 start_codon:yes stop_codon:yes gene_type:complete